jgi:hypothetical protein
MNYEAWAKNAITYIRQKGLEHDFQEWSGGWSCPVQSDRMSAAATELYEALVMVRDADDDCHSDGLQTIPRIARAKIDAAIAKAEGKA